MGRSYAGVLGPISFVIVIARSMIDGGHAGSAIIHATIALFAFAAIGYVIGVVAERTVIEAVQMKFRKQWQANEAGNGKGRSAEAQQTTAKMAA
jgi:hypothetical protein